MAKTTQPRSLRFRPWIATEIDRLARRARRPFSEIAQDLLEEALRMRQTPGIYFSDEPAGREAKVAGSGLAVWEVIRDYLAEDRNEAKLRKALPSLSAAQVKAAQLYYKRWRGEIDALIVDNDEASAESA